MDSMTPEQYAAFLAWLDGKINYHDAMASRAAGGFESGYFHHSDKANAYEAVKTYLQEHIK
jgi:hypothetical protein